MGPEGCLDTWFRGTLSSRPGFTVRVMKKCNGEAVFRRFAIWNGWIANVKDQTLFDPSVGEVWADRSVLTAKIVEP